jgi:hypothetical protein
MVTPSFPPDLGELPTPADVEASQTWWHDDGVIWHILTNTLGAGPATVVPDRQDYQGFLVVTAHKLWSLLYHLYGGGDHNTSAIIKDMTMALVCGTGCDMVQNYITSWRKALHHLAGTPWDFSPFDRIRFFIDHLPYDESYRSLHERIYDGLDMDPPFYPPFEELTEHALAINTHNRHFALHSRPVTSRRPPPVIASVSGKVPLTTSNTPAPPTATSNSRPSCSNCSAQGHVDKDCWAPGGGDEGGRNRYLASKARAHIATSDLPTPDDTSLSFVDTEHVQSPSPPTELIDLYPGVNATEFVPPLVSLISIIPSPYMDFLSAMEPRALTTFTQNFNTLLDSGCTTHIFRDHRLFWTYQDDATTPVGTANCGILQTLGRGEIRFCITGSDRSQHTFRARDCLHALDVPINLLSVGQIQEQRHCVIFDFGETSLQFC